MNRLVIIGNGFDLAHGLPTSYKNFIDDYWGNVIQKSKDNDLYDDELFSLNLNMRSIGPQGRYEFANDIKCYKTLKQFTSRNDKYCTQDFKNKFFSYLSDVAVVENWVDIENLYYLILKERVKGNFYTYNYPWEVKQLNLEFDQVKVLLEKYLNDNVLNSFQLGNFKDPKGEIFKFSNVIKPISIFSDEDKILEEFSKEDHAEIASQLNKEELGMTETKLFFLNFNYTPTLYRYLHNGKYNDKVETFINFIHGEIGNINENKINFGFGDEMDDDYKIIENLDDNEYLRNFKSFQYSQNSNYKNLLDFIDSEKFQIQIMGHSCGLSDRTLLNTVFEHNNCRSIKVFYHKKEDGTDNYTEIIQNISRHFNKKKLMREKIVNKTFCQPLPQIKLPLK
jgi:hypothetical protein